MSQESPLQTLLSRYQVRKSPQQKADFFSYVQAVCHSAGYPCGIEELPSRAKSRNIIAGDPAAARVIFTAHYDTCSETPFPNLIYPQHFGLTLLAQMPLVLLMVAAAVDMGCLIHSFAGRAVALLAGYAVYIGLFFLFFFGPANPHTANDNTSGVAALLEIMAALPPDRRRDVAFLFFDNEEMGKVGSKAYHKAHPDITAGKVLLNLDCVGDGDDFLIVAPKNADEELVQLLKTAFVDADGKRAIHCSAKNTRYNSDQLSFPNGTAAAACRKGKWGYHIPRIHTRRDVICEESNLAYVRNCALRLLDHLDTFNSSTGGTKP
ncbi:MAG: M28 family peptidase [Clostridia bacterium]|nr:M28 family peptidase [Clostridia bacterium]